MANKKNKKKIKNVPNHTNVVEKRTKNHKEIIALESNMERIAGAIISGKELNPPSSRKLKYPCAICNKSVNCNHQGLQCDRCQKWCHRSCDGMDVATYKMYEENYNNPNINPNPQTYKIHDRKQQEPQHYQST